MFGFVSKKEFNRLLENQLALQRDVLSVRQMVRTLQIETPGILRIADTPQKNHATGPRQRKVDPSSGYQRVRRFLMENPPGVYSVQDIQTRLGLNSSTVSSALSKMAIQGEVRHVSTNHYQIVGFRPVKLLKDKTKDEVPCDVVDDYPEYSKLLTRTSHKSSARKDVYAFLRKNHKVHSVGSISSGTKYPRSAVTNAVYFLKENGLIRHCGRGLYAYGGVSSDADVAKGPEEIAPRKVRNHGLAERIRHLLVSTGRTYSADTLFGMMNVDKMQDIYSALAQLKTRREAISYRRDNYMVYQAASPKADKL